MILLDVVPFIAIINILRSHRRIAIKKLSNFNNFPISEVAFDALHRRFCR